MKTMYLSISIILILLTSFFLNQVQAYDGIEIQNIQVLPRGDIIAGHPIKINATLVNNSTNPILVSHGACDSPFSVTFDNHVLVKNNNIFCTLQLLVHRLDPGKSMTSTSPGSGLLYLGAYGGTVNASVTFPYKIWNPSNQTYDKENVTKLFSFTIYNRTKIPTLSQPENQSLQLPPPPPALYIQVYPSPLQQFKTGTAANDVKCNFGFQLIFKIEDGSPACVKPASVDKLMRRGWATSTTDLKPWVKIDIPSLNDTYVVNQPISFSVTVKGFGNYPCVSPQIKIHDNKNPNVPIFQDNGF
ncbi:MAG: hypothetical protein KGI33_12395, partial [Thaumarchaeota archaeon]|nr:hypothetical protein [Nitrososphaerota archaeon]